MKNLSTVVCFPGLLACAVLLHAAESPPVLVVPTGELDLHVAVALPEGVKVDPAKKWRLVDVDDCETSVPVQLVPAITPDGTADENRCRLLASLPARSGATGPRCFRLESTKNASPTRLRFEEIGRPSLGLFEKDKPVLVYNHGSLTCEQVPKKDRRRTRSTYFHPVYGLNGEVLTGDFGLPDKHYHHHGIFWAWPTVRIDGRDHEFWMHTDDRFVQWIERRSGPVGAVLAVENGWYFDGKKAMIERVWLHAYQATEDARVLDFDFTWIPVDRPITLQGAAGKSYGGLSMRFEVPGGTKPTITVPNGVTAEDLPDTRLPWADLQRQFEGSPTVSGAAILIPPDHPDYPPTWLARHYGILCVGYPGVKAKTYTPEKPLRLSYRVWIHKGAVDAERLKREDRAYAEGRRAAWQ